jgi:hypothetical protein
VLIAGPRFMPQAFVDIDAMRGLLPIEPPGANPLRSPATPIGGTAIVPTPLGLQEPSLQLGETTEQSAAIWKELPPVEWLLEGLQAKPGAQVLAEGASRSGDGSLGPPVILRQYVGAGEVLMHATDETWRWRWRSDDRYFARPGARPSSARRRVTGDQSVRIRARRAGPIASAIAAGRSAR